MNANVNEISLNGQVYVLKGANVGNTSVTNEAGLKYSIVRTYSAGVFAGYIGKLGVSGKNGSAATVFNARRIWYWAGAATLSQLAVDGTSKPSDCKFPAEVPEVTLTEVIEVIPCSEKAMKSIASVKVWSE